MDEVEGDTGTEVENVSLSQLLAEADALPLHTSVVSGIICGRESLPCQDITALYVEEATVVQFRDGHGRSFSESVSLDACRFKLLPELEANDGKTYATVRHVMEHGNRLPSMVRALGGYSLDEIGSEDVVEPNDVFEVGTARLTRCDAECVIWFRVNNLQHEDDEDGAIALAALQAAAASSSSSTSSSSPGREPIVIPLDADCEFHTSVDNRHHALQDVVGMIRKGLLQLPVRLQVTSANAFGPSSSLPPKLVGRKFTVTGLPTKRSVVATDGADVFRIPEGLCDRVLVGDVATAMRLGVALRTVAALSQCVDERRVRTVGPPEPASISSQAVQVDSSIGGGGGGGSCGATALPRRASVSAGATTTVVASPRHFRQRFSKSLRGHNATTAAATAAAATSSYSPRTAVGILRSATMAAGLVARSAQQQRTVLDDDEYMQPRECTAVDDTNGEYCVVPERRPSAFRCSRASTMTPLQAGGDSRPAADLPPFPAADATPGGSSVRRDPYEDIQEVRKGYSTLRPGQDIPSRSRAATSASAAPPAPGGGGGGFDEENYALMTSGASAVAAATSQGNATATGNGQPSNLYSKEPNTRRTHEAVILPPKLAAKKKLSAPILTRAGVETENLYQTPPRSCEGTPSLRASGDNLYLTLVSSRPSSRTSSAQRLHLHTEDDALYSTPRSSPKPVRKSKSQPHLAQLVNSASANTAPTIAATIASVPTPQPLYVNNAETDGGGSDGAAEPTKPTPKPRRGRSSKALEPDSSTPPAGCPVKPPRVRRGPSESGYASSPTSPMYANTGQADTIAGVGIDPYVQLESFRRLSADLEKTREHLARSEAEVLSLRLQVARCKAACRCVGDAERREASYEFTVPRNLPKCSTEFIGRDSTV